MSSDLAKSIPHFIQVRGCNNCDVYGKFWEKYGKETGFDGEFHQECQEKWGDYYQVNLIVHFTDPETVLRQASFERMFGQEEGVEQAQNYCAKVKRRFGEHYNRIGVSLDDLMDSYLVTLTEPAVQVEWLFVNQ